MDYGLDLDYDFNPSGPTGYSHIMSLVCLQYTQQDIVRLRTRCFDKNGPPYKNGPVGPFLSNTMDIRHLTKMDPPY